MWFELLVVLFMFGSDAVAGIWLLVLWFGELLCFGCVFIVVYGLFGFAGYLVVLWGMLVCLGVLWLSGCCLILFTCWGFGDLGFVVC